MTTGIITGNIRSISLVDVVYDMTSVAANTTAERSVTVPGVKVGDFVLVTKPSLSAGLAIETARVSAAGTVQITVSNNTGSAIDPASETLSFLVIRPEGSANRNAVID